MGSNKFLTCLECVTFSFGHSGPDSSNVSVWSLPRMICSDLLSNCGNFATLSTFLLGPAFIMFSFHHLQATWNKGSWSKTPKSCARTTSIPNMSYSMCSAYCLQVIVCQKHSFLHQSTQNTTKDCSLNYKFVQENLGKYR